MGRFTFFSDLDLFFYSFISFINFLHCFNFWNWVFVQNSKLGGIWECFAIYDNSPLCLGHLIVLFVKDNLPLSSGRMLIWSLFFNSQMACFSAGEMLLLGVWSIAFLISKWNSHFCSKCKKCATPSMLVIMSRIGCSLGVIAKFEPLARTVSWWSDNIVELLLMPVFYFVSRASGCSLFQFKISRNWSSVRN